MKGILVALVLGAVLIVGEMIAQPRAAWAWALLLLLYVPAVFIATAVLKYLVLLSFRLRRR